MPNPEYFDSDMDIHRDSRSGSDIGTTPAESSTSGIPTDESPEPYDTDTDIRFRSHTITIPFDDLSSYSSRGSQREYVSDTDGDSGSGTELAYRSIASFADLSLADAYRIILTEPQLAFAAPPMASVPPHPHPSEVQQLSAAPDESQFRFDSSFYFHPPERHLNNFLNTETIYVNKFYNKAVMTEIFCIGTNICLVTLPRAVVDPRVTIRVKFPLDYPATIPTILDTEENEPYVAEWGNNVMRDVWRSGKSCMIQFITTLGEVLSDGYYERPKRRGEKRDRKW